MFFLSKETARKLTRLFQREAGRITSPAGLPTGPTIGSPVMKFIYIESDDAIDTSVTDPALTKDYWDAYIVVYDAASEDVVEYGEVYATTIDDSTLATGYAFGICVGFQTIDETEKPLFIPVALAGGQEITVVTCARLEEV